MDKSTRWMMVGLSIWGGVPQGSGQDTRWGWNVDRDGGTLVRFCAYAYQGSDTAAYNAAVMWCEEMYERIIKVRQGAPTGEDS